MSDQSVFDGALTTPSLSYMKIQASLITGAPIEYEEKSTINENINILKDVKPTPDQRPILEYLVVGQKGHEGQVDSDELMWTVPVAHNPTDSAPFLMVPLVAREIDNDLTEAQRSMYALRRELQFDGIRYFVYYCKRLPKQTISAKLYKTDVKDGKSTTKEFEYTDQDLYPKPTRVPSLSLEEDGSNLVSTLPDGEYVHSTVTRKIEFDEFDTQEFINVARVMRGNPLKAIMSEIVTCTGVDKDVQVPKGDGSQIMFNEVIGLQPGIFISCYHNLAQTNTRVAYEVEVGQTKPMKLRTSNG